MPRTRIAITVDDWERLTRSVPPEVTAGKPHLEYSHAKLLRYVEEVHRLVAERDFHVARAQEATEGIQVRLEDGRKVATLLRAGLKDDYGDRNEELVRFGIQPFRGKKRRKKAEEPSE